MSEGLMLGMEASGPQTEACERWADQTTDTIVFGGAKYGGKSFLGANLIFSDALTYPDTAYYIARQQLSDLRKHTTLTIAEVFRDWKIRMDDYCTFNGMDNFYRFRNGSMVYFLEARDLPRDPLFERWGSMQFTRGWIEEGGEFADLAIQNLDATVGRKNNVRYGLRGKTLITCNPKKNYLYREFYKPWKAGTLAPNRAFIRSLATDNFKGNPDYIKKLSQITDPVMRARLWEGDWEYDDDPMAMFPYDAITDMWTNDHVPGGHGYITVDVGYTGVNPDKTIIKLWNGWRLRTITKLVGADTKFTAKEVKNIAKAASVPMSRVAVDATGIGAGVVDELRCVPFIGAAKPLQDGLAPVRYLNLRAQCFDLAATKCKDRAVMVETAIDREVLEEELSHIRKANVDDDKKFQVEAKSEISKRLGRSPDYADPFSMRAYFDLLPDAKVAEHMAERVQRGRRVRLGRQQPPELRHI